LAHARLESQYMPLRSESVSTVRVSTDQGDSPSALKSQDVVSFLLQIAFVLCAIEVRAASKEVKRRSMAIISTAAQTLGLPGRLGCYMRP
jgi:hypothetical protein